MYRTGKTESSEEEGKKKIYPSIFPLLSNYSDRRLPENIHSASDKESPGRGIEGDQAEMARTVFPVVGRQDCVKAGKEQLQS